MERKDFENFKNIIINSHPVHSIGIDNPRDEQMTKQKLPQRINRSHLHTNNNSSTVISLL